MNRPNHARARARRSRRFRWIATSALCVLSGLGDPSLYLRAVAAQDPAAIATQPATNTPAADEITPQPPAPEKDNSKPKKTPTLKKGKKESLDKVLERRGTLILKDATLADWIATIQATWDVDIKYDPSQLQQEHITGTYTDLALKDILDSILGSTTFAYQQKNGILEIIPVDALGQGLRPGQKMELIEMQYANPAEVEVTLKFLLSQQGQAQSIPQSKTLMVIDAPENIAKVKEHISKLEDRARQAVEREQAAARAAQQSSQQASPNGTPIGPVAPDVQPVEQTIMSVLTPNFVNADTLQEFVQSAIGEGTVSVIADQNALVVTGTRSTLEAAARVVKELDVPRKQVRISVLMYDVRVGTLEQLGVNWRQAGKGRPGVGGVPRSLMDFNSSPLSLGQSAGGSSSSSSSSTGGSAAAAPAAPGGTTGGTTGGSTGTTSAATSGGANPFTASSLITSASPTIAGGVLTLAHLSRNFDLSAVLQALDQTDGSRLLARPTVIGYDRTPAEIKIITEIPVQQLTQTDGGGSIGTTAFREAGTTLTVTPTVCSDGSMMLDLAPEFSVLSGYQNGQPIIDRRTQKAKVRVKSGDTLVLSGLRQRNEVETVSGIPGLMNMKYVGNLFRTHRTDVDESELLTFIQTEIIDIDYRGTLREQLAQQVVLNGVDQIPMASHGPIAPPCNDPYCPLHNPRPKYYPGGNPSAGAIGTEIPQHSHVIPGDVTSPATPVQPGDAPAASKSDPMPPAPPAEAKEVPSQNPPPVMIDESTAKRRLNHRVAMQRLPSTGAVVPGAPPVMQQPLSPPPPRTAPALKPPTRTTMQFTPPNVTRPTTTPPTRTAAKPQKIPLTKEPGKTASPSSGWKNLFR